MTSFQDLPDELVELVCRTISDAYSHEVDSHAHPSSIGVAAPGLIALSLTSSRFCRVAQETLFRCAGDFRKGTAIVHFLSTLRARPDLANAVREVTFIRPDLTEVDEAALIKIGLEVGISLDDFPGAQRLDSLIGIIFLLLPNLEHIACEWTPCTSSMVIDWIGREQILHLQSAHLHRSDHGVIRANDVASLLQLPSLRTLKVQHVAGGTDLRLPENSSSVTHLELFLAELDPSTVNAMLRACKVLETFRICSYAEEGDDGEGDDEWYNRVYTNRLTPQSLVSVLIDQTTLRRLILDFDDLMSNWADEDPHLIPITSLQSMTALKHLDIHQESIRDARVWNNDADSRPDKNVLIDFLPLNLEELVLRFTTSRLLDAIKQLGCDNAAHSHIRALTVCTSPSDQQCYHTYDELEPFFTNCGINYKVLYRYGQYPR